jgi:hypothetical protein
VLTGDRRADESAFARFLPFVSPTGHRGLRRVGPRCARSRTRRRVAILDGKNAVVRFAHGRCGKTEAAISR